MNCGKFFRAAANFAKAKEHFNNAYQIFVKAFGQQHPKTTQAKQCLESVK